MTYTPSYRTSLGYPWSTCPPGQEWAWGAGTGQGCAPVAPNQTLAALAEKMFDGTSFPGDTRAQKLQYGYFAAKAILEKHGITDELTEAGTDSAMEQLAAVLRSNTQAFVDQMSAYATLSSIPNSSLTYSIDGADGKALLRSLWAHAGSGIPVYLSGADEVLAKTRPAEFGGDFFENDVQNRLYIFQSIIELDRRGMIGAPAAAAGYGSYGGPEVIAPAAPFLTPGIVLGGLAILGALIVLLVLGWQWIKGSNAVTKAVCDEATATKDPTLVKACVDMNPSPAGSIDKAVMVVVGGALVYALIVYGLPTLMKNLRPHED